MTPKTFTPDELAVRLAAHKKWLETEGDGGVRANLSDANLSDANLSRANLSRANLSRAYLSGSNLSRANLSRANLRGSDLSHSDLRGSNLSHADLSRANLDFSSGFSFCCGSFDVHIDLRIAAQLAYHFCRMQCDEPAFIAAHDALIPLANTFHRVGECGEIKPLMTALAETPE